MDPYELLLQELNRPQQGQKPMFTPEQVAERVGTNNRQTELGILGQLAGDRQIRGMGGSVFKQALGDRAEQTSAQGTMDPLTGEMNVNPEYAAAKEEARRGQVLKQAIDYQSRREAERARSEDRESDRVFKKALLAQRQAGGGGGSRGGQKLPKPVTGYMWNEDGTEQIAIPGTPQAAKAANLESANGAKASQAIERADTILAEISRAREMTTGGTTGIPGRVMGTIPATKAFDLKRSVDTIKANIGFQELQAMREASPTGGALGQVAVQELVYLQSVLGSLDTLQSAEALDRALGNVQRHFSNWKEVMAGRMPAGYAGAGRGTGQAQPGGTAPAAVAPSAPAPVAPAAPARGGQRFRMNVAGELEPVQ